MSLKIQTRKLFFASVLIFLLFTSIPPKSGINERFDPTRNQSTPGTPHDSANGTSKSISTQTVASRLSKDTSRHMTRRIQIAADQGVSEAQNNLGDKYYWGKGVKQSFPEALIHYRKAAEKGNIEAMAQIGHMYEHGLPGIRKNTHKAQNFYLAIAQQADANTLLSLGVDWEREPIKINDKVMAYLWYSLSAHKGLTHARKKRSYVARKMTVTQVLKAEQKSQRLIKKMTGKV